MQPASTRPRRARAGSIALLLGTAGCTALLDFSELPDAGPTTDASDSCTAFEDNDEAGAAAKLDSEPIVAAICLDDPPDVDFFAFTAPGGQDVAITLSMTDGSGPRSLGLRLYEHDGSVALVETDGDGDDEVISRTVADGNQLAAGDYVVEVFPTDAGNTNEYTLSVVFSAALTDR